jgi:hypothetical protein
MSCNFCRGGLRLLGWRESAPERSLPFSRPRLAGIPLFKAEGLAVLVPGPGVANAYPVRTLRERCRAAKKQAVSRRQRGLMMSLSMSCFASSRTRCGYFSPP